MRVLVVEDDKQIADFLKAGLEQECFAVDTAQDGARGAFLALTNDNDLIILDYMLPKKDGRQVCKLIREDGKTVPIIMLTVKSELPCKIDLLNLGADDYLTKPYSFEELLARIKALLRRPKQIESEVLRIDDLTLDAKRHLVKRGKKEIYLTRKQFMLLQCLMKNQGRVVSRGMIMEHVWDMEGDLFSNTIETHITTLRRKIESPKKRKLIQTVPGMGYKIS